MASIVGSPVHIPLHPLSRSPAHPHAPSSISERASPCPIHLLTDLTLKFLPFLPSVRPSVHPRVLLAANSANHSHLSVIPGMFQSIIPSRLPSFGTPPVGWGPLLHPPRRRSDVFYRSLRLYNAAHRPHYTIPHHGPCSLTPSCALLLAQ